MKVILMIMLLLSMNFMFMKHPLSLGFILLLQTITSCIMCSYNIYYYLMSYILFLIFIGGMLVLFMYMSSIASNEKFIFSMNLMLTNTFLFIVMIKLIDKIFLKHDSINLMVYLFEEKSNFLMGKLFVFPSGLMILMLVIYLLFTLIAISNILSLKMSPLRSN